VGESVVRSTVMEADMARIEEGDHPARSSASESLMGHYSE
jgi:hypothetical protein